jgi:hypothetical protein
MPFATAALNDMANGVATAATWISAHTGNPSTTGANEVTGGSYAREQTTWGAPSGGSRVGSQVAIDIAGGTTVTYWGLWTAQSGGTWKGGWQLSSPEAFGADGILEHTPTITATATN